MNLNKLLRFFYYTIVMQFLIGVSSFFPNHSIFNRIRGYMLRPFLASCGSGLQIAKGVLINMPSNMHVGNDVYIAHDVWINATGGLFIGHNVIISPKVVLATTKHVYENGMVHLRKSENAPIKIGNGSWIASNCTITMGVSIGDGCIIGACSSVTKDINNYYFAGGVPAKEIKKLKGDSI